MINKPITIALVGYGAAGKIFHAPFLSGIEGIQLTHVVSSNAAKVHADLPDVAIYPTSATAFTDAAIDLVVLATPNDTHFDLARQGLIAGKHVVVDKPFTIKLSEAEELVRIAKDVDRMLCVYQNRRFDGDFMTVRRLFDEGQLGDVLHFESHFDRYRPEVKNRWREMDIPGAGLWYDIGPHLIDQVLQLFGKPIAVYADMAVQRDGAVVDDYIHAVLRYPRMRAVLHIAAYVTGESPRFIVHGTKASYVKYGLDPQEDAIRSGRSPGGVDWGVDKRPGTLFTRDGEALIQTLQPTVPGNYFAFYNAVRDAIRGHSAPPTSHQDMVTVMKILETGFESTQSRQERPI